MEKFTVIENEEMNDEQDYDKSIKLHQIKRNTWIAFIALLVLVCVVSFITYKLTKKYTDYKVISSLDSNSNAGTKCLKYKSGLVKYDNDGITYYDDKNTVVWQQSYEMKNPVAKVCGDYVGVADIGESMIYIMDTKGFKKNIDTALSISQMEITNIGACVVTLEDKEINYIRMYDLKSDVVYDLKKIISGDGYPLDIAVSMDGKKLCVSCFRIDGIETKTKLFFYNFSEIGKNEVDYLVGSYEYKEIIPEIEFVENDKVMAVSENALIVYEMEEYPSLLTRAGFSDAIEKVFFDGKYAGIVYKSDKDDKKWTIEVYNHKGKREIAYDVDMDFDDVVFLEESMMLSNYKEVQLVDFAGRTKFEYRFDIPLKGIVWVSDKDRFIFVNEKAIQQIKLK